MPGVDPDLATRQVAITRARELADAYQDLVPLSALREGFVFRGRRISFGSFQRGIHRPRELRGPAALTLMTAAPRPGLPPPYEDEMDPERGVILYHYRAGSVDQPDNRALQAAHAFQAPLIYFHGMAPGQYVVVAPVFVRENDPADRVVLLEVGVPLADTQPGGPVSTPDARRYALREVRVRLHQQRFRLDVLRAYRHRCAICALRERQLVQAAHIVSDTTVEGIAAVVNGLALCAIHHLAYDRNLLGIDPGGVVHIAQRLRDEHDGPMLTQGLQSFHRAPILKPRKPVEHPDPDRLAICFTAFQTQAA
jgi:putative restriction endonuclease